MGCEGRNKILVEVWCLDGVGYNGGLSRQNNLDFHVRETGVDHVLKRLEEQGTFSEGEYILHIHRYSQMLRVCVEVPPPPRVTARLV